MEPLMRYLTFSLPGDRWPRMGAMSGDRVLDLKKLVGPKWPGPCPESVLDLIVCGRDGWRRMNDFVGNLGQSAGESGHGLKDITWHAPIPRPRKNIFCLGLNYASHAKESAAARGRETKLPEVPVFFTKAPTTVNGPFNAIPWDRSATGEVDYEAELGVVIGVGGKNISRDAAPGHVFGYTVINDTTARDVQMKHLQWFKGKSMDGFCPMGPVIVTADEFGDPQTKRISLRLNGETRQDSNTSNMIFPVNVILEFLTRGLTLEPGDILATGTPEGVGLGRTPPEYMKDGDLMETEIEGIGTLRNRIVAS